MLAKILVECCKICTKLPSAATSIIGGDGARTFDGEGMKNLITIDPRHDDGTPAAYIRSDDVELVVSDLNCGRELNVEKRMDAGGDCVIKVWYALDEDDSAELVFGKLQKVHVHVRVRVCGVLLVDVLCARAATFDGRTAGCLYSHRLTTIVVPPFACDGPSLSP